MFVRRIKTIATKPVCSWFFAYSLIVFGFITPAVAQNPSQYVTHTAIACICRAFIPARVNLKREIPGWSLRAVSGQARSVWNRLLGKIDIGGATAAQKTIFYTCLYRALLFPHSFYEVSARSQRIHYSPVTGKIYSGRLYTDTDFWDIAFCFSSFVAGVSTAGWADHSWFSKFL